MYVYIPACMHVGIYVSILICIYICIYTYMHIHMHVYLYAYIPTSYMQVCHTHTYTHTHTHTRTHTHTPDRAVQDFRAGKCPWPTAHPPGIVSARFRVKPVQFFLQHKGAKKRKKNQQLRSSSGVVSARFRVKPVQKKTRKQCNNRREQKKKKNQQLRSFSRCSFSRGCENFLFEIFFSFASRSRNLFLPLNLTNLFFGTFRGFFSCARKKNHVYDFSYGFFTYDFFFCARGTHVEWLL